MKCPYNEFKDCYEEECPFFFRRREFIDHKTGELGMVPQCWRAEKEKNNG